MALESGLLVICVRSVLTTDHSCNIPFVGALFTYIVCKFTPRAKLRTGRACIIFPVQAEFIRGIGSRECPPQVLRWLRCTLGPCRRCLRSTSWCVLPFEMRPEGKNGSVAADDRVVLMMTPCGLQPYHRQACVLLIILKRATKAQTSTFYR